MEEVEALLLNPCLESYEFLPHLEESFVYEDLHVGLSSKLVKQLIFSTKNPKIMAMVLPELPDSWIKLREEVRRTEDLEGWFRWNSLVLRVHKKSGDAWDFRSFLSRQKQKVPVDELDFILLQCELHPHNFYAMQYLSEIGNLFPRECLETFFRSALVRLPGQMGVEHHGRRFKIF